MYACEAGMLGSGVRVMGLQDTESFGPCFRRGTIIKGPAKP